MGEFKHLKQLIQFNTINTVRTVKNGSNSTNCINCIIVSSKYVDKAWEIVKPCLKYASDLVKYVGLDKDVAKLRDAIKNNSPIGHSKAMVKVALNAKRMREAVKTLRERGEIYRTNEEIERRGSGRITKEVYHWKDRVD